MADRLDDIDEKLTRVEERLLAGFNRIRKSLGEEPYCLIDSNLREKAGKRLAELRYHLEHSGDTRNLQLQTERHDVLNGRIGVATRLLEAKIATAYLDEAHDIVKTSRHDLERRVSVHRRKMRAMNTTDKADESAGEPARRLFSRPENTREAARNRIQVSLQEQDNLNTLETRFDNSIYSAARELAILEGLIRENIGRPPPMPKGKAEFKARELSQTIAPVLPKPKTGKAEAPDIAQSPDEIRRKLEQRSTSDFRGASQFLAKDPNDSTPPAPDPSAEIARTPEEIRRKLMARQNQTLSGRAAFSARDIEPVAPPPAREPSKTPPPPTGKAVFTARDIEPVVAPSPLLPDTTETEKDKAKDNEEQTRRTGAAVFESQDPQGSDDQK